MDNEYVKDIPPDPTNFIESMRDIGYSPETAVADIIDNSLSAEARNIWLDSPPSNDPWFAITDDGIGMSKDELIDAMRLGCRNPLDERCSADLGRFGLGLKTASFSQCRKLTVISGKDDEISAVQWDLDFVKKSSQWLVKILTQEEISSLCCFAFREIPVQGTTVLWEVMDRIEGDILEEKSSSHASFIDSIQQHLSLVFHRFMPSSSAQASLKQTVFHLNNEKLLPVDPFLASHPACQHLNSETVALTDTESVDLQAYIVPHHRHLSFSEQDALEGDDGMVRGQGFYIYRNKRLIMHGGWFGLARQQELSKLARIKVDVPSSLDREWITDVRKSSIRPPAVVRKAMKRLIDRIRGSSAKVYRYSGRKKLASTENTWLRVQKDGAVHYEISPENEYFQELKDGLNQDQKELLKRFVSSVVTQLPIQAIHADYSEYPKVLEAKQTITSSRIDELFDEIFDGTIKE